MKNHPQPRLSCSPTGLYGLLFLFDFPASTFVLSLESLTCIFQVSTEIISWLSWSSPVSALKPRNATEGIFTGPVSKQVVHSSATKYCNSTFKDFSWKYVIRALVGINADLRPRAWWLSVGSCGFSFGYYRAARELIILAIVILIISNWIVSYHCHHIRKRDTRSLVLVSINEKPKTFKSIHWSKHWPRRCPLFCNPNSHPVPMKVSFAMYLKSNFDLKYISLYCSSRKESGFNRPSSLLLSVVDERITTLPGKGDPRLGECTYIQI